MADLHDAGQVAGKTIIGGINDQDPPLQAGFSFKALSTCSGRRQWLMPKRPSRGGGGRKMGLAPEKK